MTDLEMKKLCAEAMGYTVERVGNLEEWFLPPWEEPRVYDPLNFDVQAMALVKKFRLTIYGNNGKDSWAVHSEWRDSYDAAASINTDLNRAVVEYVAKMQASRFAAAHDEGTKE